LAYRCWIFRFKCLPAAIRAEFQRIAHRTHLADTFHVSSFGALLFLSADGPEDFRELRCGLAERPHTSVTSFSSRGQRRSEPIDSLNRNAGGKDTPKNSEEYLPKELIEHPPTARDYYRV
jgi:hypothetical protein